jgi:hypothetical protein
MTKNLGSSSRVAGVLEIGASPGKAGLSTSKSRTLVIASRRSACGRTVSKRCDWGATGLTVLAARMIGRSTWDVDVVAPVPWLPREQFHARRLVAESPRQSANSAARRELRYRVASDRQASRFAHDPRPRPRPSPRPAAAAGHPSEVRGGQPAAPLAAARPWRANFLLFRNVVFHPERAGVGVG